MMGWLITSSSFPITYFLLPTKFIFPSFTNHSGVSESLPSPITSKTCADVEKSLSFTNENLMLFIYSLIKLIKNNPAAQLGWLLSFFLSDRFELSSSVHDNDDAPESGSTQVLW